MPPLNRRMVYGLHAVFADQDEREKLNWTGCARMIPRVFEQRQATRSAITPLSFAVNSGRFEKSACPDGIRWRFNPDSDGEPMRGKDRPPKSVPGPAVGVEYHPIACSETLGIALRISANQSSILPFLSWVRAKSGVPPDRSVVRSALFWNTHLRKVVRIPVED